MKIPFTLLTAILTPALAFSTVIVDDSWTDGGRTNGADLLDTDWWASTTASAIEVSTGVLGLVSGTSGRGIHGLFPTQALSVGDSLKATFTFTTPATVGTAKTAALKIGLFDTTGKPGLAADLSASSGTPNPIYNNLQGYMMDWDLNVADNSENITFRQRSNDASGQLLATTGDYSEIDNGGASYKIAANTSYTGVLTILRTDTSSLSLTGEIFQGLTPLSSHTVMDDTLTVNTYGMLAFHANSSVFGSANSVGTPDNGMDFTNVKIEYLPVPEPSLGLLAAFVALIVLGLRSRQSRK